MTGKELAEAVSTYLREKRELRETWLTLADLNVFVEWLGVENPPSLATIAHEFRSQLVRLDAETFTLRDDRGTTVKELIKDCPNRAPKNYERVDAIFRDNAGRVRG